MRIARHPEGVDAVPYPMNEPNEREEVLEEAIRQYSDTVLHLAYSYVKDYGLAEDITQEVFLKVYKHIDRFEGRGSLKTWIYSITVNYCKDHLRSWSFRKLLFLAEPDVSSAGVASTEAEALRNLQQDNLWQSVLRLPLKYREVIIMHYQQDLATTVVAHILGIREQTVRTRLHRAREALKKLLEEEGTEWMHSSDG